MSYIPNNISASSTIDAVLTREGKKILTSHDQIFKVVKYSFGDEEVNYQLLNPDNVDQDDADIISLPIPEPSTNGSTELLNKIYVNQTFANQTFSASGVTQGQQYVYITTAVGDKALLYSDNTSYKLKAWVSTFNALDRPFVDEYYRFQFTNLIDCFAIDFISPAKSDSVNLNYTKLADNDYIFTARNSDGSGKYERTSTGAPSILFTIRFVETLKFFDMIQKPENKESIIIPDFLTITDVDSNRTPISTIRPATLALEIKNVIR